MTDDDGDKSPGPSAPDTAPLLAYAPPESRPIDPAVVTCTAVATGVILLFTVSVWLAIVSLNNLYAASLVVPIALVTIAVVLALQQGRRPRGRSVALGMWIGIGLTLLVEGMCFVGSR